MSNVHETNVNEAMSDNETSSGDISMGDDTYDAVTSCPFIDIFNCESPVWDNGVVCDTCYKKQRYALDCKVAEYFANFATVDGTIVPEQRVLHELLDELRRRDDEGKEYVCPTESYAHRFDTHVGHVRSKAKGRCDPVHKKDTFCSVCVVHAILMGIASDHKEGRGGELKPLSWDCILKDDNYANKGLQFRRKMAPSSDCRRTRNQGQLCEGCWVYYSGDPKRADHLWYLTRWFDKDTRMVNTLGLTTKHT
jgi:hypothetical protein